jgi:cell division transport system permease protein
LIRHLAAGQRLDLPLDGPAPGRLLPWLIAAFVCLATVAFGVAVASENALNAFDHRTRLVTVTIPAAADAAATDRDLAAALEILIGEPAVTSVEPVALEELETLIQPWLGADAVPGELPLPRLIDVTLDATARLDLAQLQARLRDVVPRATLGIDAISGNRGARLAAFFRAWSSAIGVVVLSALLVSIAWITRLNLDVHTGAIELLRGLGATDPYLVRQFERHALLNAVRGAPVGFGAGTLILVLLIATGRWMGIAGAAELKLRAVDWTLLVCVPVVAALLVVAIERLTATWGLGRMP